MRYTIYEKYLAHPSVKVPHCARNLSYSFDLLLLFNRYLYPSPTIHSWEIKGFWST